VEEEARAVTEHLSRTLGSCSQVTRALSRLSTAFQLAVVSSSAILRVQACLDATGLTHCFATENVFSAEDSLPRPLSKPDPAIYLHALQRLRVGPPDAIAIEDSVTGTRSAVAAGLATIGNIQFVSSSEREERRSVLLSAGAVTVAESWEEIADLLAASHDSLIAPSAMPT